MDVENAPAKSTYPAGALAMARTSDPQSKGGRFFIVYKDTVLQDTVGYSIGCGSPGGTFGSR
jgi:peptidyl-prolyl cis-trans isomerase B (cyclophilin B)